MDYVSHGDIASLGRSRVTPTSNISAFDRPSPSNEDIIIISSSTKSHPPIARPPTAYPPAVCGRRAKRALASGETDPDPAVPCPVPPSNGLKSWWNGRTATAATAVAATGGVLWWRSAYWRYTPCCAVARCRARHSVTGPRITASRWPRNGWTTRQWWPRSRARLQSGTAGRRPTCRT